MELAVAPQIRQLIDDRVRSGKYRTPEDVVAAAVTQLSQQDALVELSPAEVELIYPGIRGQIAEGLASLAAGEGIDGDAFFDGLDREDDAGE